MTESRDGVRQLDLDNGFRALLVERRNLPVVATALWYGVGSRDEGVGESGVSHFLEHMMFKGTVRYGKGEIDRLTTEIGGRNNAFTDHDSTVYHFTLPAERWVEALEIEASRMNGCLLDPTEFESEKAVVLEELAMGQDDPWTMLFQEVEALAFQRHPYHRPIIGWREDLERVRVEQMRDYYARHYGPNRSFLVVVGAMDPARTADHVQRLFGKKVRCEARRPAIAETGGGPERRTVIHAPGELVRIAFACRTCRVGDPDDLVLDVIAHALGIGKSSRLHRRLSIDERLAAQVGAHNDARLDPGLFWVQAELHHGVDPAVAEAAVREELGRVAARGLTDAEIARARVQIRSAFLFEEETALGKALKLGRFEALTDRGWRALETIEAAYDAIDNQAVRETAARWFGGEWTAGWSLPEGQRQATSFAVGVTPGRVGVRPIQAAIARSAGDGSRARRRTRRGRDEKMKTTTKTKHATRTKAKRGTAATTRAAARQATKKSAAKAARQTARRTAKKSTATTRTKTTKTAKPARKSAKNSSKSTTRTAAKSTATNRRTTTTTTRKRTSAPRESVVRKEPRVGEIRLVGRRTSR
jgi:zinc protease